MTTKAEEELVKLKSDMRMLTLKLEALIDILTKEGVMTHEEVEQAMKDLSDHGD